MHMIKRQKLEALVLSRRSIGEADRLVTFFTRQHGIVRAVAKGVRKIPSRRGPHLEPYTRVLGLLTESRAGTYVGAVETQEYFPDLVSNQPALGHARNMSLVITKLIGEGDPQPYIYDYVLRSWRQLPTAAPAKRRLMEGSVIMMTLQSAGLMPNLRSCLVCGAQKPSEAVVLNSYQGGWRCLLCTESLGDTKYSLSPRSLQILRFMAVYPQRAVKVNTSDEESSQLLQSIRRCVADLVERPLLAT